MLCTENETRFECHELNKSNLYVRRDGVFYHIEHKNQTIENRVYKKTN